MKGTLYQIVQCVPLSELNQPAQGDIPVRGQVFSTAVRVFLVAGLVALLTASLASPVENSLFLRFTAVFV